MPGFKHPAQCFSNWWIFAKFRPEKYDFNLYKGFSVGKKWLKFARFLIFKYPESYDIFQKVVKSIEGIFFLFFSYFHISYVAKFG